MFESEKCLLKYTRNEVKTNVAQLYDVAYRYRCSGIAFEMFHQAETDDLHREAVTDRTIYI